MTLIIAVGNADQFIQVSDRRLTSNGVVVDDESNKSIVLNCRNARLSVGFTGLARAGKFNTKDWILQTLNESASPDYSAENLIKRFTNKATDEFANNSDLQKTDKAHKRLSIMFTGYLYHHNPPLAGLAVVSNYKNLDTGTEEACALDSFQCFFREEPRPYNGEIALFFTLGTLPHAPKEDIQKITVLVKKRKPAKAIVDKLVEIIRKLSGLPSSNQVIGKQLDSIILPRDRNLSANCNYHSDIVKIESYMPDQVMVMSEKLHMNVCNISIQPYGNDNVIPMSGPKLKPKQPCWCGSGKKYKKCHGNAPNQNSTWGLEFKADE